MSSRTRLLLAALWSCSACATAAAPHVQQSSAAPTPPLPAGAGAPAAPDPEFACTLVIGINATEEWYSKGFEALVDDTRWELIKVHSGFVTVWADPAARAWSTPATSPCATNAGSPDRVIFVGLQFDFTTVEQWLPPLRAVVKNLQAKYPGVRRIELGTFVRAPGNAACPQAPPKRSTIAPAEDAAIEVVAKENPGLVTIAPRFEAVACDEFSNNPPHPSAEGGAAWARRIAEHYGPRR
jgi:hypothetical protein